MSDILQKMKDFLETDEGKDSIRKWALKMEREDAHQKRWVDKFKQRCEGDMDTCLEILFKKYHSDTYRDKEYRKGREPRETLLWLAWEYATEHCKECKDETYFNMFTGGAYYIGSYVVQLMIGQGSALRFDKIEEDITDRDLMS
jgi:hypothetical protein